MQVPSSALDEEYLHTQASWDMWKSNCKPTRRRVSSTPIRGSGTPRSPSRKFQFAPTTKWALPMRAKWATPEVHAAAHRPS